MRKNISLLLSALFIHLVILAQETIKFDEKSIIVSLDVAQQANKHYQGISFGEELIIDVLTKKEQKKLSNKDQLNFSRVRSKKLATYYKDTLGISPQNILLQFKPFENKKKKGNGHPLTGVTWTRDNFKQLTNRNGIFRLVVIKQELLAATGVINDTINGVQIITYNNKYGSYLHGRNTTVFIPPGAFDSGCKEITIELKEFFSPSEILLAGLTTTSGNEPLRTGGMIHIMSYCNGEEIPLKKGKKAEINFLNITESYGIFYGDNKAGLIDWEIDKDAQTILNPFEYDEETEEQGGLKVLTDKFGWINCDAFIDDKGPRTELLVNLKEEIENTTAFRLIFHDIKSVLPGFYTNNDRSKVKFINLPAGRKTSLLVFKLVKDKDIIIWAIKGLETGKDKVVSDLNFKTSSLKEFKKITDSIWQ